jgi:hypothetical protein
MGKLTQGILGPVSGTVGTVTGASWKGIPTLRAKSNAKRTKFTQVQLEQQAKFATVIKFLSPITAILENTFYDKSVKRSGFNTAVSFNITNAITGTYPAYAIDYSKARVAKGKLPMASAPSAMYIAATKSIHYSWVDNSGTSRAKSSDRAVYIVFCPAKDEGIYMLNGPVRSDEGNGADASVAQFAGHQVHTYLSFLGDKPGDVATSVYTGVFMVTP